jgi:hypothetical protein
VVGPHRRCHHRLLLQLHPTCRRRLLWLLLRRWRRRLRRRRRRRTHPAAAAAATSPHLPPPTAVAAVAAVAAAVAEAEAEPDTPRCRCRAAPQPVLAAAVAAAAAAAAAAAECMGIAAEGPSGGAAGGPASLQEPRPRMPLSVAEEVGAGRPPDLDRATAAAGFEDSDSCGWPARAMPACRPGSAAAESARPGVEPGERSPPPPHPPFPGSGSGPRCQMPCRNGAELRLGHYLCPSIPSALNPFLSPVCFVAGILQDDQLKSTQDMHRRGPQTRHTAALIRFPRCNRTQGNTTYPGLATQQVPQAPRPASAAAGMVRGPGAW